MYEKSPMQDTRKGWVGAYHALFNTPLHEETHDSNRALLTDTAAPLPKQINASVTIHHPLVPPFISTSVDRKIVRPLTTVVILAPSSTFFL